MGWVLFQLPLIVCLFWLSSGFNVDPSLVSVSGFSSGGFMAVQFHIAFSQSIKGVGVIAGGPYWCAEGEISIALTSCIKYAELINVDLLVRETVALVSNKEDDPLTLGNATVYLFSGELDTVVNTGVVKKLATYYSYFMLLDQITQVYNISAEHSFPTNNASFAECNHLGYPFINYCSYDGAGAILQNIYGKLNPPVTPNYQNVIQLDQASFIPKGWNTTSSSLYHYAYAYVPTNCASNKTSCALHIAFHGCLQTILNIGDVYYKYTGYNNWAESNNIIILYPQANATQPTPDNPDGCWDWWGYTTSMYVVRDAPQLATVQTMVKYLMRD